MTEDRPTVSKLDVLGDSTAREVLSALNTGAYSVKELAEQLDMSLPTIYRRLDQLEEHDFVTKRSIVSTDGNHYHVYSSDFKSALVTLQGGEYDVQVFRDDSCSDKFAELWSVVRHVRNE